MARSDLIHRYLSELETYLSRVSEARAHEVVQEIESHIYDSLDLQTEPQDDAVEAILGRLGTPRELAAGYIDHITIGVAPPRGMKPLSRVRRGISKSFYWLVSGLGYGTAFALFALAFLKLISPETSGIWIAEYGNSIVISFSPHDDQATELPAALLVPSCMLLGAGLVYLTTRVSRVLKMHVYS